MKKNIRVTILLIMTFLLSLTGCRNDSVQVGDNPNPISLNQVSEDDIFAMTCETDISDNCISDSSLSSDELSANTISTDNGDESDSMIILGFAGDMNLDENWCTTQYLNEQENGIYDCIEPAIIEDMCFCDIFMLNNEFTYSDRGTPLEGKAYTFRAAPERVEILEEMGVDIVLLANNHVYDYGADALIDTFATLENAGIDYVGAGNNLNEACNIVYYEIDGVRIAYVAASRAEKNRMTPQATETEPGILRAYDAELFLSLVREADANSDIVIANIHWGTEYSDVLESVQTELGHDLVDAGADVVIGTHPHVLQGIEYYKGVPIFYSLGNFWFNEKDLYSGYVRIMVSAEDKAISSVQFIPCIQQNCTERLCTEGEEKEEVLDYLEEISDGIQLDENGYVEQY